MTPTPTAICFEAKPYEIGNWTVLRLPKEASDKLPSRGMTLVNGEINNFRSKIVLEPDGKGSHWFRIDNALGKGAGIKAGDTVAMAMEPSKDWPEPEVPTDIRMALDADAQANSLWTQITPMARWDWIRWIRSTNNQETRQHRIDVTCDKLRKGMRRPCCFNRNTCTEPYVSKGWMLIDPEQAT